MNGEQTIGIWHCNREGFTVDGECSHGGWHRPEDLVVVDAATVAELFNVAADLASHLDLFLYEYPVASTANQAFWRWRQLAARLGVDR